VVFGRALPVRIRRKTVLGFSNAYREVPVALFLQFLKTIANLLIRDDVIGAVKLARNGLGFLP
jgi:hypothetical protein